MYPAGRVWLVTSRLGTGKNNNLFYSVPVKIIFLPLVWGQLVHTCVGEFEDHSCRDGWYKFLRVLVNATVVCFLFTQLMFLNHVFHAHIHHPIHLVLIIDPTVRYSYIYYVLVPTSLTV
jgi:hypothetical protein